jgi:hypothetical protein
MRALIEQLPPHYREALVLREMNELSYQQIAEMTATPFGTVMSQLSRARHLSVAWKPQHITPRKPRSVGDSQRRSLTTSRLKNCWSWPKNTRL